MSKNFSDRFLGIVAGTKPPGNDPHTVAEAFRNNGAIPEEMLPYSPDLQTVEEYYSFKNAEEANCKSVGNDWLTQYGFGHEWVFEPMLVQSNETQQKAMMEALQYSPLGVAVYAWTKDKNELYYRPPGAFDTHWVVIYGYVENKYWKCFDSYDGGLKKLAWDFNFRFVKRFHIEKKTEVIHHRNWLIDLFYRIIGIFKW